MRAPEDQRGSTLKRRELIGRAAGALGAAAALQRAEALAAPSPDGLEVDVVRLHLKHTWTTTMSSSEYRDTIELRFTREGATGVGAGAPIVRYQENAADGKR